jgi:glycosyltransferase involved in cell wall biosynthesis/GT2 family glycosyltransferase
MENVNLRLLEQLGPLGPVDLSGPEGCAAYATRAGAVGESGLRPLWRFVIESAVRSAGLALRRRPRLVIAGSGLAAPMAWLAARLCGAVPAVYLHGLDIIVPNRIYQALWLPFIRRCRLVFVNSANTARLAQAAGLHADRLYVLHPGTDVPALLPGSRQGFRTRHNLGERLVLLSVGRLTRRKGLAEFVAHALPLIAAEQPSVVLVVIGEDASDALHGAPGSERARVLESAREHGVEDRLLLLGRRSRSELAEAYEAADLHVFPVLDTPGDVEGFGMVALESAAHGLRTVAFAVGGIPDALRPPTTGLLVASGDYPGMARAALELVRSEFTAEQVDACRRFAMEKDWAHFGKRLRQVVRDALPAGPPLPLSTRAEVAGLASITVTYSPDLAVLRRQLAQLPGPMLKVLVDNGSPPTLLEALRRLACEFDATLVENGVNLGLARASNLGAAAAVSERPDLDMLLLLDQDTEPGEGGVRALLEAWKRLHATDAVLGCIGPALQDESTGASHGFHCIRGWRWTRVQPRGAEPVRVDNLNGSGTLVPVQLFERLGGLSSELFIDHVDTDWAFRVRSAGHTLYGVPDVSFLHRMGERGVRFWCLGWRVWPHRSPARHYFLFRNTVRLLRSEGVPAVWKAWAPVKLALTFLVHLVSDPARFAQASNMARGVRDGLRPWSRLAR